jgi:CRISPR/Cas system-associated protein endoribonuclease Cas2
MLDEKLDPYLIEVNHAPSFATDSNLDMEIKKQLLLDSFRMLNMSVKRKIKYKKDSNKISQNRIFTGRKDPTNHIIKDKVRKLNNIERHKFEYENKGKYELLYPLINEKDKIVGKHSAYMYEYPTDTETKHGSRNSIHEATNDIETGITQSSTQDLSEERVLTEIEKMNNKYQQYIDDAFEVWDDLCNGFKYKNKYSVSELESSGRKSKVDMLNSRNPNRAKNFQKTMRFVPKPGFGSTSIRADIPPRRLTNKQEPAKPSNVSEALKSKRSLYSTTQTQNKILMSHVLSKYVSKSIMITSETEARQVPQGDRGRKGTKLNDQ